MMFLPYYAVRAATEQGEDLLREIGEVENEEESRRRRMMFGERLAYDLDNNILHRLGAARWY